jgi:hypothetical protein
LPKKKLFQKTTTISGDWIVDLVHSVGQYIRFETTDGVFRKGRLSSVKMRDFLWNGKKISIPVAIELDGDSADATPFDRLASFGLEEL